MLVASALLLLCAGFGGAIYAATSRPTIYTVSEVASGLNQNPAAWVGRTVLIWGRDVSARWGCGFWWGATSSAARGANPLTCRAGTTEQLVPARPTQMFWAARGLRPLIGTRFNYTRAGVRLFVLGRGLMVRRHSGAHLPATSAPVGLIVQLARLPIVGQLIPTTLVESGAVYRVRLLDPSHCSSPPRPEGELQ
jgi:hypothetical protein